MWYGHEGMGWWMIFGGIFMLLFWGAIIFLVVWGVNKLREPRGSSSDTNEESSPLDIAKERYARGEISQEEFEQIKKNLS